MAEVEYYQKLDEESGLYLKVEAETGEVVKKKTTPGPYKGLPFVGETSLLEEEEEEEEVVVEKKREVLKEERIPERKRISIDDSIAKIVSYDKEGIFLIFEDEPGRFVELPEDVVDSLGKENRERYILSQYSNKRLVREREHPEDFKTQGISVEAAITTARKRLAVEGIQPGYRPCWKSPAELASAARLGYRIARYKGLKTFSNEGDEVHKVSAFGQDELILTEVPEETHQAVLKYHSDKSRRRVKTTEEAGAADIRAAGGIPYRPNKADDKRLPWTRSPGPNLNE